MSGLVCLPSHVSTIPSPKYYFPCQIIMWRQAQQELAYVLTLDHHRAVTKITYWTTFFMGWTIGSRNATEEEGKTLNKITSYSKNGLPGSIPNESVSGELGTRHLINLFTTAKEGRQTKNEREKLLCIGSAFLAVAAVMATVDKNCVGIGVEIQTSSVYCAKVLLPNEIPRNLLQRIEIVQMDFLKLNTFNPATCVYANCTG